MSDEIWVSTFQRMRKRLLGMAGRLLSDDEDAQDVLQNAFCRLWTKYRDVKSEREAEALTVTTVRNLSISTLRNRHYSNSLENDESAELEVVAENEFVDREEQYETVERLIQEHLSPLQRTILRRREIEGEEINHIASELGMQETAVRMNLSRARKSIRELYQKEKESSWKE